MEVNVDQLLQMQINGAHASIVIGVNGSGKSSILLKIAKHHISEGRPVVVICNTVYDRFKFVRNIKKIRPNSQLPLRLMKNAIIHALQEGPFRLRIISDTLEYLGYSPLIGLRIDDFKPYPNLLYGERLFEGSETLSKDDCDEILSSVSVSGGERWGRTKITCCGS